MSQSDARRLERLMRRHAQGKLSDSDLVRAQEEMLGGGSSQRTPSGQQAVSGATGAVESPNPSMRERFRQELQQARDVQGKGNGSGQNADVGQNNAPKDEFRRQVQAREQDQGTTNGVPPGAQQQGTQMPQGGQEQTEDAEDGGSKAKNTVAQVIGFLVMLAAFVASRIFGN